MAAYKDEQRGTWYVSFHYYDWTGKNCRKVKRGFKTKREATEWERHFRMKEAAELDMTFEDFVKAYTSVINNHNSSIAEVSSSDNENFQKWRALWRKPEQNYR